MKLEKDSNDGVEMVMYSVLVLLVGFFLGFCFCVWCNKGNYRTIKHQDSMIRKLDTEVELQYDLIKKQSGYIDLQDSLIYKYILKEDFR